MTAQGSEKNSTADDDYEGLEFVDDYEIVGYECMCCDSTQENPGDCVICCGPTMPMYF